MLRGRDPTACRLHPEDSWAELLNQKDKELGREEGGAPGPGGQENIVV